MISLEEQIRALVDGRAYVDLSEHRQALVRGDDARTWLNDLVTAEMAGLGPGDATRSFLLSPTGRIRADFTVAFLEGGFLLVQDPGQPSAVAEILAPYVLSSDVRIDPAGFRILAFTGEAPSTAGGQTYAPSALGEGTDVVLRPGDPEPVEELSGLVPASADAVEAWRVRMGIARFGADLREDSLPHEAGLDELIALSKGCFLGQEAVAKVRNLGRPPFAVIAARAEGRVDPGARLLAGDDEVGAVTSAAPDDGGTAIVARVRWAAKDAGLTTREGVPLTTRGLAAGNRSG